MSQKHYKVGSGRSCCCSSSRCPLCRVPSGALALLFELLSATDLHSLQLSCCAAATAFSPQLARGRLQRDFGASGGAHLLSSTPSDATAPPAERLTAENEGSCHPSFFTHLAKQGQNKADCCCSSSATEENTAAEVYKQLCANRAENLLRLSALRYEQRSSSINNGSTGANILGTGIKGTHNASSPDSECSRPCVKTRGRCCGVFETSADSGGSRENEGLQGALAPASSVAGAVACCVRAATAGEVAACRAVLSTGPPGAPPPAPSATSFAGGACLLLESDHLIAPCIAPFVFAAKGNKSITAAATAPPPSALAASLEIKARAEATTPEASTVQGKARDNPRGARPRRTQLEWHLFGCLVFPAPGEGRSALLIAIDARRQPTASTHALAQEKNLEELGSAPGTVLLLQQFLISSLRAQHLAAEIPLGDLPQVTYCCGMSRVTAQTYQQQTRQETVVAAWDRAARRFIVTRLRRAAQIFERCKERILYEQQQAFQQDQAHLHNAAGLPEQQPEEDSARGPHTTGAAAAAVAAEAAVAAAGAAAAAAANLPVSSNWEFCPLSPAGYGVQPNPSRMQWVQPLCVGDPSLHQRLCVHASELPPLVVGFDDGSVSLFKLPRMDEIKLLGPSSTGSPQFSEFVDGRGVCTWGEMLLLLQVECYCSTNRGSSSMAGLRVFLLSLYPVRSVATAATRADEATAGTAVSTSTSAASTSPETEGESKEAMHELQQVSRSPEVSVGVVAINFNGRTVTVTLRRPSCICFLDVQCILQQQQRDEQTEKHDPRMRLGQEGEFDLPAYLEHMQSAAARAGAFVISSWSACAGELAAAPSLKTTVASASDLKGVGWLLQWNATRLTHTTTAGAYALRPPASNQRPHSQYHQRSVTARVFMRCRVACCCPSEVGCVVTDEQCCFFALKGSSQLFLCPIDWRATNKELLTGIDTRAVNAPGHLGAPSLLSRAWLTGADAESRVQQMALEKLYVAGPFLVAARRHDRMQVLLLPLQCQQHFPHTHALKQEQKAVSARAEADCTET